ncbi:MAG: DoxX family protein [Bacteroidota bacterium]
MRFLGQNFKRQDWIHVVPRLIVTIILLQTLPFKFSGAEESVYIFSLLNMEPWGRYLIATLELVSSLLLLSPYYIMGAIISLSIISAANFLHFVKLGFIVNEDGGVLFVLSIIVVVCSLWTVIYWNRMRSKKNEKDFNLGLE